MKIQKNLPSVSLFKFNAKYLIRETSRGTFSFDPPSIGAYSVGSGTVTINGINVGDIINVYRPSALAGIVIAGTEIASANTLTLYLGNITAAALDYGPLTFQYQWIDLT